MNERQPAATCGICGCTVGPAFRGLTVTWCDSCGRLSDEERAAKKETPILLMTGETVGGVDRYGREWRTK